MHKKFIKLIKIIAAILCLFLVVLIVLFYRFSIPKTDNYIKDEFAEYNVAVFIKQQKFNNFEYRVLTTKKEIDTTIPTLVFVHGSIGSALDFKKYLVDAELNKNANLIAYDRIGYGIHKTGEVQESIAFEVELLEDLIADLAIAKTILVGYSYGGPIALASKKKYKKVVLLAPAVFSSVEPMPWALNLYNWKATRWLLPAVWKAASKEKLSHRKDLLNFETDWNSTPSSVLSIHGSEDWIVPYENSMFLKEQFTSNQFELVTLDGVGHELVWSNFNEIKQNLLQQLK